MSLDLKRQLIMQLVESSRLLRNYIDSRAKGRGSTRAQWIVLFRLREQEGLSQVDLADVLELQPISLVRLLDRLVEHGLVVAVPALPVGTSGRHRLGGAHRLDRLDPGGIARLQRVEPGLPDAGGKQMDRLDIEHPIRLRRSMRLLGHEARAELVSPRHGLTLPS